MKRPAFQTSPETLAIFARMQRAAIGETVSYAQILDLTGLQTVDHARQYIITARRQLWRAQIYTRCERSLGIIRTDGDGAVDLTSRKEETIARAQKRTRRQWEQIVDASAEKLAVRTKTLYKYEMMSALNKLFKRTNLQELRQIVPKIDPKKIVNLFAKRVA